MVWGWLVGQPHILRGFPMLRLIKLVGDTIIIVGVLSACGAQSSPAGATKRLNEADAGRSINLRVGDQLNITLAGNPTTGYQWEVGTGNAAVLRSRGEPEFVSSSSAIGSGGKVTLHFDAVATGTVELKLIYHRSFEKQAPPAETFEVTIIVR